MLDQVTNEVALHQGGNGFATYFTNRFWRDIAKGALDDIVPWGIESRKRRQRRANEDFADGQYAILKRVPFDVARYHAAVRGQCRCGASTLHPTVRRAECAHKTHHLVGGHGSATLWARVERIVAYFPTPRTRCHRLDHRWAGKTFVTTRTNGRVFLVNKFAVDAR